MSKMNAMIYYWWEGNLNGQCIEINSPIPSSHQLIVYGRTMDDELTYRKFDPRRDWNAWVDGMNPQRHVIPCWLIPELGLFYGDAQVVEKWRNLSLASAAWPCRPVRGLQRPTTL